MLQTQLAVRAIALAPKAPFADKVKGVFFLPFYSCICRIENQLLNTVFLLANRKLGRTGT